MIGKGIALALLLAAAAVPAGASELTEAARTALPPMISYRELPGQQTVVFDGWTIPYTAGQLVADLKRRDMYMTGYVFSSTTGDNAAAEALFAPYFRYQLTPEDYEGLAAVNRSFFDEDAPLHQAVQAAVTRWADQIVGGTGANLEVPLRDMEPVRRAGDMNCVVYTAGARIVLSSDGLILPMYGRGYMYKDGSHYRTVVLITGDDSRQILTYALEDMVKAAAEAAAQRDLAAFVASIDLSGKK